MRTTLDLDAGVLRAARALADHERISLGAAVSELARRGMVTGPGAVAPDGFPILAQGSADFVITSDVVADYRDDEG
ncbi:hypothetical protein [Agromyces mangrovi Wang et al. 2018]|uniref:hypothetical protein n=1 Tax=Agromyces mangrovi TaxID=1858653 RepID=UPI00257223F4|nr:hypothetical protein [Agromyces mangrovi]BDZ65489.1 putative antitoxin VapB38 [Agromyces mangrovi]